MSCERHTCYALAFIKAERGQHGFHSRDRACAAQHRHAGDEAEGASCSDPERYPDVSKKEIVRAAFYAVTEEPSASELHHFALTERIAQDNDGEVLRVGKRKKKRQADAEKRSQAH